MNEQPIILIDDPATIADYEIMDLQIDVLDEPLCFQIGVKDRPVRLSDMVPAARSLLDKLIEIVTKNLEESGQTISCHKGCHYCCYYIVPVLPSEAFRIRDEILTMDSNQREQVLLNILNAIKCIKEYNISELVFDKITNGQDPVELLDSLSDWYKKLGFGCPFIIDKVCSIYEQRPLICRELLTLSPPDTCKVEASVTSQPVTLPISIAKALKVAADKMENTTTGIILLALLIPWCEENGQRYGKTFPAKDIVESFFEEIKTNLIVHSSKS